MSSSAGNIAPVMLAVVNSVVYVCIPMRCSHCDTAATPHRKRSTGIVMDWENESTIPVLGWASAWILEPVSLGDTTADGRSWTPVTVIG